MHVIEHPAVIAFDQSLNDPFCEGSLSSPTPTEDVGSQNSPSRQRQAWIFALQLRARVGVRRRRSISLLVEVVLAAVEHRIGRDIDHPAAPLSEAAAHDFR